MAIGYLIGFAFALLFEAIALAGEMVGTLSGLSSTSLFSHFGEIPLALLSRLFVLLGVTLFFVLDLHHLLIRVLFESFSSLPVGFSLSPSLLASFAALSSMIFQSALSFALVPFFLLLLTLFFIALLARFFPELHFLSIGFPLQILVGFLALALFLPTFAPHLLLSFAKIKALLSKMVVPSYGKS